MSVKQHNFRIRSFVRRDGRKTAAQERAWSLLWPRFGLQVAEQPLDIEHVFQRKAATFLEIGFGSGQSLLALAKAHPEENFIGVETHQPGIGALLHGMQVDGLTNIRVYYADVIDVLEKCIPDVSLAGVQIFFPDPWPKRRHHQRRLIQSDFLKLIISKLVLDGQMHLATDWEDYALHMMQVLSSDPALKNLFGEGNFATRSPRRPIVTKFERRAEREGRKVFELQFSVALLRDCHCGLA